VPGPTIITATSSPLTFGSLFSGIGGFDLGLERAGLHCAWQVEKDPYCLQVLARSFPNVERFADVRDFPPREQSLDRFHVDLICVVPGRRRSYRPDPRCRGSRSRRRAEGRLPAGSGPRQEAGRGTAWRGGSRARSQCQPRVCRGGRSSDLPPGRLLLDVLGDVRGAAADPDPGGEKTNVHPADATTTQSEGLWLLPSRSTR
jgi:hypothetical protein